MLAVAAQDDGGWAFDAPTRAGRAGPMLGDTHGPADTRAATISAVDGYAHAILDGLMEPVVIADASGRVTHLNRPAEQAFGYPLAEAVGKPFELLVPHAEAPRAPLARRNDGSTFPVAHSGQSVEVDGDRFQVHLIRDVSDERDRLHREERFFMNASHELRAPVTTLKASAEVLLDVLSPDLPEDKRRVLENIWRDAERLATLVDDLLDLNSIRACRIQLHLTLCDLRDVASLTARAMEPLAYRRGQTLDLVNPPEPVRALVDAELLGRALTNLVSNACKYGRKGGRVEVRLEANADQATFTVSDDGPGICKGDRERVFQRFYRSPTADGRRVQGNGLGLPLCRAAVELHGGRVWADAGPGGGSVFRVVLLLQDRLLADF
jgi:signal transduction histidine kinase